MSGLEGESPSRARYCWPRRAPPAVRRGAVRPRGRPRGRRAGRLIQLHRRARPLQAALEALAILARDVLDDRARYPGQEQLRLLESEPIRRAHFPDHGSLPVAHVGDHHVDVVTAAPSGKPDPGQRENDEGPREGGPSATTLHGASYFSSTLAPASWSSFWSFSPSSRSTPSLTGLGASSTSALASLRPRPVAARTTLITWIFLSPAPVRTTSKAVCSSASSAGSPAPAPVVGAAAATAAAETPNSSSSALMRSDSSSTEMPLSSSIHSCVLVAMVSSPPGSQSGRGQGPDRDPSPR